MRPRTRDNLIYLAVGLGIAALMVADAFWAVGNDQEIWMPSRFAFRVAGYVGVLGYFVARETRKVKATVFETVMCVLVAGALQLGTALAFRQVFAARFGIVLWGLVVLEWFLIVQLMVRAVRYLRSRSPGT